MLCNTLQRYLMQAKASDAVESAAERVQQNTSSSTIQNAAESVKKAAKAGDSAPMHGRTAIITGVHPTAIPLCASLLRSTDNAAVQTAVSLLGDNAYCSYEWEVQLQIIMRWHMGGASLLQVATRASAMSPA